VVGEGHDAHLHTTGLEKGGTRRLRQVAPGARVGDPRRVEATDRFEQRGSPIVEGVIVGEAHVVDPRELERLEGDGRSAEVEVATGPEALAARRDAALEIDECEVGVPEQRQDVAPDVARARALERLASEPREHDVAPEGEGDRPGIGGHGECRAGEEQRKRAAHAPSDTGGAAARRSRATPDQHAV
jgi:hypothetical protein